MDASFFRDFARRVRELLLVARTDAARRQLAIWGKEFDRRAEALERDLANSPADGSKRTD